MKYKQTLFWASIAIVSATGFGCSDDSGKSAGASDPCALCTSDQVCENGSCIDNPSGGANNQPGGNQPGGNQPGGNQPGGNQPGDQPSMGDGCSPECTGIESCVEGKCEPCATACGNVCCENGQLCDLVYEGCSDACADGSSKCADECCGEGYSCHSEYGCVKDCSDSQTACDSYQMSTVLCCDEGFVCADGDCVVSCSPEVEQCGNICCEANQECHNGACRDKCEGIRCGEDEALCCDSASEVCLFAQCMAKGSPCSSSNDCALDEYCEETLQMCVGVDVDPNACVVLPKAGKFEPSLKWHWPKTSTPNGVPTVHPEYDQVMNNPIVINLTDDNGDGKIDENDIPDLVFTSFSKTLKDHHYTGTNVLRAISGDDGHELATHPDVKFWLSRDPGAAKVNHDEYPELVFRIQDTDGVTRTVILNLVPKTDGSGYEFKEIAKLDGDGQFPRFVNFDGGEYPQIVTSAGIIEYNEDENGVGTYSYRCKSGFGTGLGGYTAADLDGDGEIELVGGGIYDKNCKRISTDTVKGYTVLADLDLVNDHANGRLDVEQLGMVSGGSGSGNIVTPPPGTVHAYKIFKDPQTGLFSREQIWQRDMPVDYAYVDSVMAKTMSYTYPDGNKLSCTRQLSATANSSAATNTDEYKEYRRRSMCSTGGGPLVVADFNGDKKPDIGLATAWSYVVYDGTGDILWTDFNTQDYSSKATGSSLFDFEGDGVAEVLYADELNLHVYRGPGNDAVQHGYRSAEKLINDIPNSSGTLIEYPLVVDVDNDYHSEIVVVSNDYAFEKTVTGIRAYYDPSGHWVRTRRIWNQFDYHVTNINEDGTVPKHEQQNWKVSGLNNFRQNVQPDGLFNAPNLVASSIEADTSAGCGFVCNGSMNDNVLLTIQANIENKGSLGVKSGVNVTFYVVQNGVTARIGSTKIDKVVAPGASASASYKWIGGHAKRVDNGEDVLIEYSQNMMIYYIIDEATENNTEGDIIECIETDNTADAMTIKCPVPIC